MFTLAIHPGALGDVLLAIPALRALRAASHHDLVLAAQPRLGALLVALGEVDRAIAFDVLRLGALFVDDGGASGAALTGAGRVVCWFGAGDPGFRRRLRALVPGAIVAAPMEGAIVWRHLLSTVQVQAGAAVAMTPAPIDPVDVPPSLTAEGRRALGAAGWDGATPIVLAHPGAGGTAKRWSADGFASVLGTLWRQGGVVPALHQGPADADAVATVQSRLDVRVPTLVEPPLPVLAGALRCVRAFIGNDSGISHLAAAVGTPSVVLYRPATMAWRPWPAHARVLTVSTAGLEPREVALVTREAAGLL